MDDPLANFLPGSPSPFRRFAMSVGVCFVCLWRDRNNGFDVLERKQFLNESSDRIIQSAPLGLFDMMLGPNDLSW